ncbi:thiolase-like protein [Armillaria mellea]|nr:thiolase-like protein [Armillaria mellea]
MALNSDSNTLPAVAIVGISLEFPGGQELPENLGLFRILPVSLGQAWYGKKNDSVVTKKGSFLKSIALFDPVEFGITSRDVVTMAVSTRKLIEHSFLALLDAGIDYRGHNVGCFMSSTMETVYTADPTNVESAGSLAGYPYAAANKVSYHLDLRGPTIPTTTACSSTATALYLAVQALRARDCEAAVVGGCQLNYTVEDWVQYSNGKILSPDGECKPFDASADGFSRSEGVVVLVVKLLDQAISDGDHIYASILGVGINSTGSAAPVSAPVADAQADAMRRAFSGTGREPSEVDFVELHATGTAAGDPTEANWVGKAFQRDDVLPIGSVKGNIGHMEITSFFASVSKICSMFDTKIIPPTVGIRTLNPLIEWKKYRLDVPTSISHLSIRSSSGRPLISINSSGIGGANAHAVLEGPPSIALPKDYPADNGPTLLDHPSQARAISTVYGRQARQMTWRTYAIHNPKASTLSFSPPTLCPRQSSRSPIIFVFSGQGPQHINMGRELFNAFPVFRDSVLRMDAIYESVWTQILGRTSVPVHSTLMEVCHDEFQDLVSQVVEEHAMAAPSLPVYSTVTGTRQTEAFTSQYFWENTRQPVLFSSTAARVREDYPDAIYVEIGPHPVLATYVENPQVKAVLCPLIRPRSSAPHSPTEPYTFLDCLGRIAVLGPKHSQLDFRRLNMYHGTLKDVPTFAYPFQRKEIPYYRGPSTQNTAQGCVRIARNGPLGQKDMNISASSHPSLIDHVICGEPIMPAAGYIEMALAAGGRVLWNVAFEAIMPLSKNARPVKFQLDGCHWTVVSTVNSSKTSATQSHAQGHMSKAKISRPPNLDINTFQSQNMQLNVENFYEALSYFAQYGPPYQRVAACWMNEQEGLFQIRAADEEMISEGYTVHPAILDSCIHSAVHHRITGNMDPNSYFLPSRVEVVTLYDKPEPEVLRKVLYAKIVRQKWMPGLVGEDGQHILKLSGLKVERHYLSPVKPMTRSFEMIHQPYGLPPLPLHHPLEEKELEPRFPEPNGTSPKLDFILEEIIERLHRAVDVIVDDNIRVLRILDLSVEDSIWAPLSLRVLHLMNERQVFLEYCSIGAGQTPFNDSDACSYRNVGIDWD